MFVTFNWHLKRYALETAVQYQLTRYAAMLCVDGDAQTFADLARVARLVLTTDWRMTFLRSTAIYFCDVHPLLSIGKLNELVQEQQGGDECMAEVAKEWARIESESEGIKSELTEEGKELNLKHVSAELSVRLHLAGFRLRTSEVIYYSDLLLTRWGVLED